MKSAQRSNLLARSTSLIFPPILFRQACQACNTWRSRCHPLSSREELPIETQKPRSCRRDSLISANGGDGTPTLRTRTQQVHILANAARYHTGLSSPADNGFSLGQSRAEQRRRQMGCTPSAEEPLDVGELEGCHHTHAETLHYGTYWPEFGQSTRGKRTVKSNSCN